MSERPETTPPYETSDAEPRPLFGFLLGLAALVVTSFLVTTWLLGALEEEQEGASEAHPMVGFRRPPTGPLLQANPTAEITAHQATVEERISRFAWVDRENGVVRIPIDLAINLVLERGLPVREAEGGDQE